jgi:hypothetical protein
LVFWQQLFLEKPGVEAQGQPPRVTIVVASLEPRTLGAAMKEISGTLRTIIEGPGSCDLRAQLLSSEIQGASSVRETYTTYLPHCGELRAMHLRENAALGNRSRSRVAKFFEIGGVVRKYEDF